MQQVAGDKARLGGHHDSFVNNTAFGLNQVNTLINVSSLLIVTTLIYYSIHNTGWPFSLCKTSRWPQNKGSALAQAWQKRYNHKKINSENDIYRFANISLCKFSAEKADIPSRFVCVYVCTCLYKLWQVCFGLARPGQARPKRNFCLESRGGFAQAEWSPCT